MDDVLMCFNRLPNTIACLLGDITELEPNYKSLDEGIRVFFHFEFTEIGDLKCRERTGSKKCTIQYIEYNAPDGDYLMNE